VLFGVVWPGDHDPGVASIDDEPSRKVAIGGAGRVHCQARPRAMPVDPVPDPDLLHEPLHDLDRIGAVGVDPEFSYRLLSVQRP
jgi:hypothetical protein